MERDRISPKSGKGNFAVTKVSALHKKWMKNKEYRQAYQDLAPELALARAVIKTRVDRVTTQKRLLQRVGKQTPLAHYPDVNA